jgi:hypothetical protein
VQLSEYPPKTIYRFLQYNTTILACCGRQYHSAGAKRKPKRPLEPTTFISAAKNWLPPAADGVSYGVCAVEGKEFLYVRYHWAIIPVSLLRKDMRNCTLYPLDDQLWCCRTPAGDADHDNNARRMISKHLICLFHEGALLCSLL